MTSGAERSGVRAGRRATTLLLAYALSMVAMVGWASPALAITPDTGFEACILEKHNAARGGAGLAPLKKRSEMVTYARSHTALMISDDGLFHSTESALKKATTGWSMLAENVGRGGSCESLHNKFMESPGHRANIMNSKLTSIGVGGAQAPDGRMYVTVIFAQHQEPAATTTTTTPPPPPTTTTTAPKPTTTTQPKPATTQPKPKPPTTEPAPTTTTSEATTTTTSTTSTTTTTLPTTTTTVAEVTTTTQVATTTSTASVTTTTTEAVPTTTAPADTTTTMGRESRERTTEACVDDSSFVATVLCVGVESSGVVVEGARVAFHVWRTWLGSLLG